MTMVSVENKMKLLSHDESEENISNTMILNNGDVVTLEEYKSSSLEFIKQLIEEINEEAESKDIKLNDGQRLLMSRFVMLLENDDFLKKSYRWRLYRDAPRVVMHVLLTLDNPCWIPEFMDPMIAEVEEQHGCDPREIERLSKIIPECRHTNLLSV